MILFITLFIISTNLYSRNDLDSLLHNYSNLESLDDSLQKDILYNIAFYYTNSKPDSSLIFSKQLIEVAKVEKNNYWLYKGYLQRGNAYRIKGELDKAVDYYFSSLKAAEDCNYKKGIGIVFTSLGDTYASAKNQSNSINYYNKAIKILREESDSISLAITLLNIGGQFIDFNIIDTALIYLKESKDIFEKYEYKIGIAYNLGNLGIAYAKKGNYKQAEYNIILASDMLKKLGDNYSISAFNANLAKTYIANKNYKKALSPAMLSYNIARENGLLSQLRDASEQLAFLHNKLNNFQEAFNYQSQYIAYRDSINNEETIRKMADLRTEYEVAQKQAEVEKAQTQLELETKRRQNQQIVGIGLIVVIFLSGALSYLLFRNARRDRYINRLLREQKEELMAQRDMLEDVNNTKDRFFSIISHDLRGPIGVLNGTTMLIREFLESKDYAQLDDLTTNMEYSIKKVQNLLDNLLEWAVSQRGQYNYVAEKVELNQVMLETISIFSDMAQAKNIVISYEQKYSEAHITVDRNSLTTILRNLISNAIKFTNKCGVVDIVVEKGKSETQILVKDTGVGIPHDKLQTLFDIEAKKSTWGTAKEKGLGIGLNLVHEFVKMNKGDIQVKSTLGVGTTFIITFPTQHKLVDAEKAKFL